MSKEKEPKKEKKNRLAEGAKAFARGLGTFIQGSIVASDKALDFAQETKERSSRGVLAHNQGNKSKFHVEERKESILYERKFSEDGKEYFVRSSDGEFQPITEEQEEDDGYFGITDPGLTAPKMTMGIRNSFGDFFGTAADAMEERERRKG